MRVYHRIIGDPPSRGFGSDISSVDFPSGNWAAKLTERRLPTISSVPFFEQQQHFEKSLVEVQCAYELQSLDFEQIAVIFSSEGMVARAKRAEGRPHGYSHIALLTQAATTPDEWLLYNEFMSLETFWALKANETTISATNWTPSGNALPAWDASITDEMQAALVLRYWRSATERAFDPANRPNPVRVCLGNEKVGRTIIQEGKRFFATCLLPMLPKSVHHMVSMSAPVPLKQIQKFSPTALAFLYPEKSLGADNELLFDLRNASFVPLSPNELAFAQQIMVHKTFKGLQALYAQYQSQFAQHTGADDTPFMADYHIAWDLYQLEACNVSSAEQISLCRDIHEKLVLRHGFTDTQVDALQMPMEVQIMGALVDARAAIDMEEANFFFLLGKALRTPNLSLKDAMLHLLCKHRFSRQLPFFVKRLTVGLLRTAFKNERIYDVFYTMLAQTYLAPPLDQEHLDILCTADYKALCDQFPDLHRATTQYLIDFGSANKDLILFIMPLAMHFLDERAVCKQSIELLLNQYVDSLPTQDITKRIKDAEHVLDGENRELLNQYYTSILCAHVSDIGSAADICIQMDQDTCEALCRVLSSEQAQSTPLDNAQLDTMLDKLLPATKDKERVQVALLDYISRTLNSSIEQKTNRMQWLVEVDAKGSLLAPPKRRDIVVRYFTDFYIRTNRDAQRLPDDRNFVTVKHWLATMSSAQIGQHEPSLKQLYAMLGDAGKAQLQELLPYFTSTSDNEVINQTYLSTLQLELRNGWGSQGYFSVISAQTEKWQKGNIKPEQLLDSATTHAATDTLKRQFGTFTSPKDYANAYNEAKGKPDDAFLALWRSELQAAFVANYQKLMLKQETLAKVEKLTKLSETLGAAPALAGVSAQQVYNAVSNADAFITRSLPSLDGSQTIEETRKMIAQLHTQVEPKLVAHLAECLYQKTFGSGAQPLPFQRKRMAAAFIAAGPAKQSFRADYLLDSLPWKDNITKPFQQDQAALFMQIAALFRFAQELDTGYPPLLKQALQKDRYAEYTKRVQASKKEVEKLMLWLVDQNILNSINPTLAFIEWLNGQ